MQTLSSAGPGHSGVAGAACGGMSKRSCLAAAEVPVGRSVTDAQQPSMGLGLLVGTGAAARRSSSTRQRLSCWGTWLWPAAGMVPCARLSPAPLGMGLVGRSRRYNVPTRTETFYFLPATSLRQRRNGRYKGPESEHKG